MSPQQGAGQHSSEQPKMLLNIHKATTAVQMWCSAHLMAVDGTEASDYGMQEWHHQGTGNAPPQLLVVGVHHPYLLAE